MMTTTNANAAGNALRRIAFAELANALCIDRPALRGIVGARDFPQPAGRIDGEWAWRVLDVATWLAAHNWTADARAVLTFRHDSNGEK